MYGESVREGLWCCEGDGMAGVANLDEVWSCGRDCGLLIWKRVGEMGPEIDEQIPALLRPKVRALGTERTIRWSER